MTYHSHRITAAGIIEVKQQTPDGGWHRYCLTPGDSLEGQPGEVIMTAGECWDEDLIHEFTTRKTAP